MNNIIKVNFLKRGAPTSLLGMSLDGSRLECVVVRRTNESLQIGQRVAANLSLDPLTAAPELVGREILNHLEAAGVRERRCVVAIPLKWALAAHAKVPPKLSEADAEDFLGIEAERGFPTDLETLQVAMSRLVSSTGDQHVTFVGIPKSHAERLEQVLRAAKLKPIHFTLGIVALQPAGTEKSEGVLALWVGEGQAGLQITCGGGIAALRALESAPDSEATTSEGQPERIAREARITLGQLPADLRGLVKHIRIFGPANLAQAVADEMRPRFEPAGLKIETVSTYPGNEFGRTLAANTPVSGAFSLAARGVCGQAGPLEFMPPKVSAWKRFTMKYGAGNLRKGAFAAAAVIVVICGIFGYQQWRLSSLTAEWNGMKKKVGELHAIRDQIARYHPWYDTSYRGLNLLKEITQSFPEQGSLMTAKSVEFRDMNTVSISGNAQTYEAIQDTIRKLGMNMPDKTNLVPQTRGVNPIQFTFDLQLSGAHVQ
jgi:hypothetical protein